MVYIASCHESYSSLVLYQVSLFSSDVNVGVVAIDSWVALESSSLLIDVVVIVVLTGSSESLVLSRDTLFGSVFFHMQSSSGCASSNFLVFGELRYARSEKHILTFRCWPNMLLSDHRCGQTKKYVLVHRLGTHLTQLFDELEKSSCHHIVSGWWA